MLVKKKTDIVQTGRNFVRIAKPDVRFSDLYCIWKPGLKKVWFLNKSGVWTLTLIFFQLN